MLNKDSLSNNTFTGLSVRINWFVSTKVAGNPMRKSLTQSLKVVVSWQQVWTTGRSRLLGGSRLLANTGWPVIKEFCLFSSAFTLGSTCCWGGCSTSYWIANLFLGGLFQPGGQMRVEKAIRDLRRAEDDKLEWGDGNTEMAWGAAGAMRKSIFTQMDVEHCWNTRLLIIFSASMELLSLFWRSMWLSPSLDHRASLSDGVGGETQSGVYITHYL